MCIVLKNLSNFVLNYIDLFLFYMLKYVCKK